MRRAGWRWRAASCLKPSLGRRWSRWWRRWGWRGCWPACRPPSRLTPTTRTGPTSDLIRPRCTRRQADTQPDAVDVSASTSGPMAGVAERVTDDETGPVDVLDEVLDRWTIPGYQAWLGRM